MSNLDRTVVVDNIASSVPTVLPPVVVSAVQVNLAWIASVDDSGVVGYRVRVSWLGGSFQSADLTLTSYSFAAAPGTFYTFLVSSFDANGNESAARPVTATTPASTVPQPTLTANGGPGVVNLLAAYTGPPGLGTFTFQNAPAATGPWSTLATQTSPTLQYAGTTGTTYFNRVMVNTSEIPSRPSAFSASANAVPTAPGAFDFYIGPSGSDSNAGTQTSPWAYTAVNTKRAAYSGKKVGWLDGTYNVASLMSTAQDPPALNIEGGTAAASTVMQAVNPRAVTITANNGFFGGGVSNNTAMIGQGLGVTNNGYVTLDGFVLKGASLFSLMFGNHNNANVDKPGLVVRNCEFTANSAVGSAVASGINVCPITLFQGVGALFDNCYIHDNFGIDTAHFSAAYVWNSKGTIFQYCTIINSGGLHGKEAGNQGTTIQYNYIDWTAGPAGQNGACIQGFDGAPTVGLTQTTSIHHNVLLCNDEFLDLEAELNNGGWTTPCLIYANTMVSTSALANDGLRWFEQAAGSKLLKFYNNLFAGPAPGGYGYVLANSDAFALSDYNGYGAGLKFSSVTPGGFSSAGASAVTTIPAWQSVIGIANEAHSSSFVASFIGPANTAAGYTLTPGTSGTWNSANPGRLGGATAGGAVTLGAFDGLTAQVGIDFTPAPNFVGPTANSVAAAISTALNNPLSAGLGPFYWEIGDATGKLCGGSVGVATAANTAISTTQLPIGQQVQSTTKMSIASASKFAYACYVVQMRGGAGNLTTGPVSDVDCLHMTSGYSNLPSTECQGIATVNLCVTANGTANTQTPGEQGKFHYDGGHMEKHASLYTPLANLSVSALTAAVRAMLNVGTNFLYTQPLLAGGLFGSSDDYAAVLRGVLNGSLLMRDALGTNTVCTLPSACPSSVYTPPGLNNFNWRYSMGHWVEQDPNFNNDGSYSSPGAFGFYPWIEPSKTYYGTIAVQSPTGGAGGKSATLGQLIRYAFMTGIDQSANSLPGPLAVPALTFPALGSCNIGGPQNYDQAAVLQRSKLEDICIYGFYNGWQSGRALNAAQVCAQVKAGSVRNTKIFAYMDALNLAGEAGFSAFMNQVNSANWYARSSWPSGAIQSFNGGQSGYVFVGGPNGVGARTFTQFAADYFMDWAVNGGAAGLATNATDVPNPNLDGIYEDDLQVVMPFSAQLSTGAAATDANLRAGQMAILSRCQQDKAGFKVVGNVAPFCNPGAVTTEFNGNLSGGAMEGMLGEPWSNETFGTPPLAFVNAYQKTMATFNSDQLGVFFHANLTANGIDPFEASNGNVAYRGSRHGIAACLVCGNGRYFPSLGNYSPNTNVGVWFDEFAVNIGNHQPVPQASAGPFMGYLGVAVDPPQTAPFQGVLWRRRFTKGEAWWSPKQSGGGTADFGRTVFFIQGGQAPAVNTGGSGTSRAMTSRDGLIVLYS